MLMIYFIVRDSVFGLFQTEIFLVLKLQGRFQDIVRLSYFVKKYTLMVKKIILITKILIIKDKITHFHIFRAKLNKNYFILLMSKYFLNEVDFEI